ncbi:MAG TPA: hypothetical protein VGL72_14845 [Bryobacteraceae bacterium]|jgi:hypothetical protein
MKTIKFRIAALCGILSAGVVSAQPQQPAAILPLAPPVVSTVPSNGDVNPYGVAVVPRSLLGNTVLQAGDILVSNFNNNQNLQGTGSTIVRISQQGQQSLFYQAPVVGLTAALGVLSDGIVVAGNLPTADGTSATVQPGSLMFIDPRGNLLGAINGTNYVNGPWGLAVHDFGGGAAQIFVSNVLAGNVIRFDVTYDGGGQMVKVRDAVVVASGYSHRTDPAALVLGPSGLAYDEKHDTLYVASSADNAIYALQGAGQTGSTLGTGLMIFNDATKLHGPLMLSLAPTGHLIVANSDGSNADENQPSELVEFTTGGQFIGQYSVDPNNGGAFGLSVTAIGPATVRVAAVDDNANALKIFTTVVQ